MENVICCYHKNENVDFGQTLPKRKWWGKGLCLYFDIPNVRQVNFLKSLESIIGEAGFVWLCKQETHLPNWIALEVLKNFPSRILLVNPDTLEQIWANVDVITNSTPPIGLCPSWCSLVPNRKWWLRIRRLEQAQEDIVDRHFGEWGKSLEARSRAIRDGYFIFDSPVNLRGVDFNAHN